MKRYLVYRQRDGVPRRNPAGTQGDFGAEIEAIGFARDWLENNNKEAVAVYDQETSAVVYERWAVGFEDDLYVISTRGRPHVYEILRAAPNTLVNTAEGTATTHPVVKHIVLDPNTEKLRRIVGRVFNG